MAYTPGPWWADGSDITTDDNLCVAVVQRPRIDDDGGYMSNATANANARVISAAPDMLKALQELREAFCSSPEDRRRDRLFRAWQMAGEALEKARSHELEVPDEQ